MAQAAALDLTIERVFDAPRETVFKAWTDPRMLGKWWGPVEYPVFSASMDVRVGGVWRNGLRSPDTGKELWHGGVFREIEPPSRLVFTFAWEEEGERGLETVVTVLLRAEGKRTRMIFHQTPFVSVSERDGHAYGWGSAFGRLDQGLAAA